MPDAIAYISRDTDGQLWKKALEAALGPVDFRTLDNLGDKAGIEVVLSVVLFTACSVYIRLRLRVLPPKPKK